jgi:D-sedoheptulose 7-phosphate isomerase
MLAHMLASIIEAEIAEHRSVLDSLELWAAKPFAELAQTSVIALKGGGKLMLFGNGGSAGDAQHIATELTVRYKKDRPAIAAIALTTDSSAITAIGNDFCFEDIFSRQVEALGRPGDVAIGISTSGNSANVLRGLSTAKKLGCHAMGFAGNDGGRMREICEPLIIVPSRTTARIQEMHILLGHSLCQAIELGMGYA